MIWGGPDDGMEVVVMDDCRAFDHQVLQRPEMAAKHEHVEMGNPVRRHYTLVRIDSQGRAVFRIERCAP